MNKYAKAVMAALVAAYALYQVATGIASPGGEGITVNEWVNIVVATVVSGVGVWAVPNDTEPKVPDAVRAVRERSGV